MVLKYDYIEGTTLFSYVKENRKRITVPFIVDFLGTMLHLFYELDRRKLVHGDFHSRNILVTNPSEFILNSKPEFKVTDFGVNGITSYADFTDDYVQLRKVLLFLLEQITYQDLSGEDKYIFNVLNDHFTKHLLERDLTRDPLARNPEALLKKLLGLRTEYAKQASLDQGKLVNPFEYLSCEQIGEQYSLLQALYSDKFLGISDIESASNLMLTGPRGCGKTTVFRSLSFNRSLSENEVKEKVILAKKYIGIYIHGNELYLKFPRYQQSIKDSRINLPLHFLINRLVMEIFEVLENLKKSDSGISNDNEARICNELWDILQLKRPQSPSADTFASLTVALNQDCKSKVTKFNTKQPVKSPLHSPETFLTVCKFLQSKVSVLVDRPFYIFIDDYSMPHISEDLQKNLNRLLMLRNPYCFFKMATESPVSYAASDVDGKAYVEGREFAVLNLGLIFLRENAIRKLEFIDDIFHRRFKAVSDYPVSTLEELIGNGEDLSHYQVADKIADGQKLTWWGRQTFSSMCSGDIHQLITIAKKMVTDSGGTKSLVESEKTPKLEATIQNKAIRTHAGDFLKSIADSSSDGAHLRQVVNAFGNVANSYLKYKSSKNQGRLTRSLVSRIELREAPFFEGKAKDIYDGLIRYSIFIQDPRGKSISGQLVPRLFLRRFLIPHFNITFSTRDSITLGLKDFEMLIMNPKEFEKQKTLKKPSIDEDTPVQSDFDFDSEV